MHWNVPLNLYQRVVFVDWHGVLSSRTFWSSVQGAERNRHQLSKKLKWLFQSAAIDNWMLGYLDTDYILRMIGITADDAKVLRQTVLRECRTARPRAEVVQQVKELRSRNLVVLASDNMDCFAQAVLVRRDLPRIFDDYLISSELKALKRDPHAFFGPWLSAAGLSFQDAILIDDSDENCSAFVSAGGRAVLFDGSIESAAAVGRYC